MYAAGYGSRNSKRHIMDVRLWEFFEADNNRAKASELLHDICSPKDKRQLPHDLNAKLIEKMQYQTLVLEELNDLFLCSIKANCSSLYALAMMEDGAANAESKSKDESKKLPQLPAGTLPAVASFVGLFDFLQSRLVGSEGV